MKHAEKEHEAQAEELQRTIRDLSAKVSSARSCADAQARTKPSSESASGARSCADAGDDQSAQPSSSQAEWEERLDKISQAYINNCIHT